MKEIWLLAVWVAIFSHFEFLVECCLVRHPDHCRVMRFLLTNNHLISDPISGANRSLLTMMRWLHEASHECRVITTARIPSTFGIALEDHLSQVGASAPSALSTPTGVGGAAVHYRLNGIDVTLLLTKHNDESRPDHHEGLQYLHLVKETLDDFAPDQLIAFNGHPMVLAALALARKRAITTVFTVRAEGYDDRVYFDSVDHVFTPSRYLSDRCQSILGLPSTPLDPPLDWASILAPEASRAFVAFVNPSLHKGVMLFARLAAMLGDRRPDIPLLVVQSGQSAGFLNGIPGLDFSKYPQIMAAPAVSTPAEYFALTRILLVPSLMESFGRVAAEAMINSIPAIVSDRGGLPDTVGGDFFEGGGARVLPLPGSMTLHNAQLPTEEEVRPWFHAVCELWDNPDLYKRIADRAQQIARTRYSEEILRKKYVNYLTGLRPSGIVASAPQRS
jgi:glycosyltransferase involved in cell wall biosynthesis